MTTNAAEGPKDSGKGDFWEHRWATGQTRFDQNRVHPALHELLASPESDKLGIKREGHAFVPGCGRGYDVDRLARRGLETVGLDISETGVAAAREWLATRPPPPATANVIVGDFFTYEPPAPLDVIYDYTFLCALPPDLRSRWAETMTRLSNPDTRLITLQFPLNGNPGGPPFSLTEQIYHDLLDQDWEILFEKDIPSEQKRVNSPPGDERLVVWGRKNAA